MSQFALPFGFSVVGGIALFVVLLVPVLVAQYRRYGRLSPRRILAVSAVCVYAVAVVAYTFLPLPGSTADCGPRGGARLQLVPFQFLRDIARETRGLGVVGTLTSGVTLQVVFNVALFVPFGLLVRRFGGRSLAVTTGLGLLLTLAIETTQGTALWGVYDCAWRVGDVDDVLANTLGALVGALLAPRFLSWLPRPEQLAPRRLEPRRVTPVRRWLGMVVDLTIYTVGAAVLAFAVRAGVQLAGLPAADARDGWAAALPPLLAGVATFLVPALTGTGASYGQRLVWLRPSWPAPPTLVRRPARRGRRPRLDGVVRARGAGRPRGPGAGGRPGPVAPGSGLALRGAGDATFPRPLAAAGGRGDDGLAAGRAGSDGVPRH